MAAVADAGPEGDLATQEGAGYVYQEGFGALWDWGIVQRRTWAQLGPEDITEMVHAEFLRRKRQQQQDAEAMEASIKPEAKPSPYATRAKRRKGGGLRPAPRQGAPAGSALASAPAPLPAPADWAELLSPGQPLLDMILGQLDAASLARTVHVCKGWAATARPLLASKMESLDLDAIIEAHPRDGARMCLLLSEEISTHAKARGETRGPACGVICRSLKLGGALPEIMRLLPSDDDLAMHCQEEEVSLGKAAQAAEAAAEMEPQTAGIDQAATHVDETVVDTSQRGCAPRVLMTGYAKALKALAACFPDVTHLDLSAKAPLGPPGLHHRSTGSWLSDQGLLCVLRAFGPRLTALDVSWHGCSPNSPLGCSPTFARALACCPALQDLKAVGVRSMAGDALEGALDGAFRDTVRAIDVRYCPEVDAALVRELGGCPRLGQVGVHLRDLTSDSAAYGLWGLATTPKAMAGALVEMTRKRFQAMTGGDLSSEEEAEEAGGLPERQHVEGSLDVLLSMGTLPEGASQWPRRFTLGGRGRRPPLAAPSRLPAISNAEFQVGYKREASAADGLRQLAVGMEALEREMHGNGVVLTVDIEVIPWQPA